MARKIFRDTVLYDKGTNLNASANIVGYNNISVGRVFKVKHWDPSPGMA